MGQLLAEKREETVLSSLENNKSIEECNYHQKKSQNLTRWKPSPWWVPQLPVSILALFHSPDKSPVLVQTIPPYISPAPCSGTQSILLTAFTWKPSLSTSSSLYQSQWTCCISKIYLLSEASAHFFFVLTLLFLEIVTLSIKTSLEQMPLLPNSLRV